MKEAQETRAQSGLKLLDWRFLLPGFRGDTPFEHLALLGGSEEMAAQVKGAGIAREVSLDPPASRRADAVIRLHSARADIRESLLLVDQGGVLYYEGSAQHPFPGGAALRKIRRAIVNAGLLPAAEYLVYPNFADRQMYLPLGVPPAISWYMQTFPGEIWWLRFLVPSAAAGSLWRAARHYAITAVHGPGGDTAPSLLSRTDLLQTLHASARQAVVFTRGNDFNRVVLFPFGERSRHPLAVVKIGRSPARNGLNENEQRAVSSIRELLSGDMRSSVPRPLGTVRWAELLAGVESCAPGRSLEMPTSERLPLSRRLRDLRLVAGWLTEFGLQAQVSSGEWTDDLLREWVEEPIALYTGAFGLQHSEARLFAQIRQQARKLIGERLPIIWLHWGFSGRNLFRQEDRITVIDWEGGSPGPPLYDLLYFITNWSFAARGLHDRRAQLRGFRELFGTRNYGDPITDGAYSAIAHYAGTLRIDPGFLPVLQVMMWVERALGRLKTGQEPSRDDVRDVRLGNPYVDYVMLLSTASESIFS